MNQYLCRDLAISRSSRVSKKKRRERLPESDSCCAPPPREPRDRRTGLCLDLVHDRPLILTDCTADSADNSTTRRRVWSRPRAAFRISLFTSLIMEGSAHEATANDEAIARAIADSENSQSKTSDCPGRHGLELFQASNLQRVSCNSCRNRIANGRRVWSCVECNFDLCEACHSRGVQPSSVSGCARDTARHGGRSNDDSSPLSSPQMPSSHMCLVPCQIGPTTTVEMLVDTGAQSSVLSSAVVRQLGLAGRVDRRHQGVAAGVGRARISGKLRNIVCSP